MAGEAYEYAVANVGLTLVSEDEAYEYAVVGNVTAEVPQLVKYWTGTAWVNAPLRYWNGVEWVNPDTVLRWNGSAWVPVV